MVCYIKANDSPMNKYIAFSILLSDLAACSLTSRRDTGDAHRVFSAPLAGDALCQALRGSLTIDYPQVPDTLATSRIALIDQNGRLDYFAGMRWADFLPGNIQSALIGSFSGSFASVTSDDTITRSRFVLDSEIKAFEA